MIEKIVKLLTSPVFWSAVGATVALLAFLVTNLKGRPLWYRRMAKHLARERAFYASFGPHEAPPGEKAEEGLANSYFAAVESGIAAVEALSPAERRAASKDLVVLVGELQKTHETLVKALQPFSTTDARSFIDGWHTVEEDLVTIYRGGVVVSSAHTHCTLIEQLVQQLTYGERAINSDQLRQLGFSVVTQDRDVILPVMKSLLARCASEVAIIAASLRAGDVRRAILLKEKYWFDVQRTYERIDQALGKMQSVARQLSMGATGTSIGA